ncbi:MAG: hypothetical protein F4Y26_16150 [Gammaproteobacteria bacterium]|nr:hypothetical protein [Gammaproteobacteria bacterium]
MRPTLELVRALYGTPFVHRNAVTRGEFFHLLEAWTSSGDGDERYPVLILSYHGLQGSILLQEQSGQFDWDDEDELDAFADSIVTLDEIGEVLAGKCKNRVVHFSSCSSLDVAHDEINEFIDMTGASAVSGYMKDLPWSHSLALDLLFIEGIQTATNINLTPKKMSEINDDLRWWTLQNLSDLPEGDGHLPTAEMMKTLGFNLRVRSVPAG